MFDTDLNELDARATLASAARLHEQRVEIDLALIEHALHFADLHPDPAELDGDHLPPPAPGRERGKVYGGVGCPAVAEFVPAEFGAVTGKGKYAAAHFIGQALALRHRLPLTWAQVRAGHATEWKARQVATACDGLSEQAAALVDERVAHILDTLTPLRVERIVRVAKWQADPEAARAEAEEKARERGVWPGRTDDHGTTTLFLRAATGDVIRFHATVNQVADALAALGDTDPIDVRRAKAVGIIADPALTHRLLEVAHHLITTPTPDPAPASTPGPARTTPSPAPAPGPARTTPSPAPAPGPARTTPASAPVAGSARTAPGAAAGPGSARTAPAPGPAQTPGSPATATAEPTTAADGDGDGDGCDGAVRDGWDWEPGEEPDFEADFETDRDSPHLSSAGHPLDDWTSGIPTQPPHPASHQNTTTRSSQPGAPNPALAPAPVSALTPASAPAATSAPTLAPTLALEPTSASASMAASAPTDASVPGSAAPTPARPLASALALVPALASDPAAALATAAGSDNVDSPGMDDAARRQIARRMDEIKQVADRDGVGSGNRRGKTRTTLYVHITDQTLLGDDGVARVEGFGPALVTRLSELLGHDQVVIQPVIDLSDTISVDAYEIPRRIAERVKLRYPIEQFPYGTAETGIKTDLDHIKPYDNNGPPGQTSTDNLTPLGRLSHRIKTHGGWNVTRLDNDTLEWTTRYGFTLHVTHRGTYLIHNNTEPLIHNNTQPEQPQQPESGPKSDQPSRCRADDGLGAVAERGLSGRVGCPGDCLGGVGTPGAGAARSGDGRRAPDGSLGEGRGH